jgi:hypothetical protein
MAAAFASSLATARAASPAACVTAGIVVVDFVVFICILSLNIVDTPLYNVSVTVCQGLIMVKKAQPVPKPLPRAKPLFSLGLDPAERKALDKAAEAEDRSAAYVARRAITEWLKEKGFLK